MLNLTEAEIYILAVNAGNLLYSKVAEAMANGSLEDAEWMFEDNTLVWC